MRRTWTFLSFAAETICMARVIFLMLPTERTFRLIARTERMAGIVSGLLREDRLVLGDGVLERGLGVGLELLALADFLAHAGVVLREMLEEPLLEGLHLRDG